jgi:hypothetical protein
LELQLLLCIADQYIVGIVILELDVKGYQLVRSSVLDCNLRAEQVAASGDKVGVRLTTFEHYRGICGLDDDSLPRRQCGAPQTDYENRGYYCNGGQSNTHVASDREAIPFSGAYAFLIK